MKAQKILSMIASALLSTVVAVSSTVNSFAKSSETDVVSDVNIYKNLIDSFEQNINENSAYKCSLDLEVSESMCEGWGPVIKPINISGIINNKDGKSSIDGKIKYDSKDLVSLNAIYDSTAKKGYVKVPELSNSYISGTADDLKKILDDINSSDDDDYISFETMMANNIFNQLNLPDLKFEAADLTDKVVEYLGVVADNIPEMTDGNTISGDIDGHKYNYTSKVCKISGYDAKKISQAIYDKAKDDEVIKEFSNLFADSEQSYEERLKESLLSGYDDMTDKELKENVDLNVYYNNDSFVGFCISNNISETRLILIKDNDDFALDFTDKNEYSTDTLKVSLNTNSGILNGIFNYSSQMEGISQNSKITVTDLEIAPDSISGKITIEDTEMYDDEDDVIGLTEIDFNHNREKIDVAIKYSFDNQAFVKVHFVGEKLEPTDIVIPTENVYSIDNENELLNFIGSCDIIGFTNHIKNILGNDLYNAIKDAFEFGNPDDSEVDSNTNIDNISLTDNSNAEIKNNTDTNSKAQENKENKKDDKSVSNFSDTSASTGLKSGITGILVFAAGTIIVAFKKKK